MKIKDGDFRGTAQLGERPVYIEAKGKWRVGQVVHAFGRLYVACEEQKKPSRMKFCLVDTSPAELDY